MADDPALRSAKQDGAYLRRVLGIDRDHQHALCPVCKKRNMRVGPSKDGTDVHMWQCMTGCGKGTVVDAIMVCENKDLKTAIAEAKAAYSNGSSKTSTQQPTRWQKNGLQNTSKPADEIRYGRPHDDPVLDIERAEKFITTSHNYLRDNLDIVTQYKRGISIDIIEKYRLGFIHNERITWYPDSKNGWLIPAAWVLPVTDAEGVLKAVKLHFEVRPQIKQQDGSYGSCEGKSRWAPFGTVPTYDRENNITPNHSYYGLWPHPDTLEKPPQVDDFSTDIGWWIQRIPESGELHDRWEREVEWQRMQIALELSVTTDALDPAQAWAAMQRAFDEMRTEIMKAVYKTETKATGVASGEQTEIDWSDYVFICPGELKAFAILSSGLMATASTAGEGWIPPPDLLSSFAGMKVCLMRDDDPPRVIQSTGKIICPGKLWARQMALALARQGVTEIMSISGGYQITEAKAKTNGHGKPHVEVEQMTVTQEAPGEENW